MVARPPIPISIRSGRGSTKPASSIAFHIGESSYNELFSMHWGEEANPAVASPVGVPMDLLLRRPADHGHDGRAHLPQPLRPLPQRTGHVDRERVAVGAIPHARHGQDERHGPQRPLARRTHHRAAERDLQAARFRVAVSRRADRRTRRPDRCLTSAIRFGLPARRRSRRSTERSPPACPSPAPPTFARIMGDNARNLVGR